jgi:hypothetical protein
MTLPAPPFFDPASAGRVFRVPYEERAREATAWAGAHGLPPATEDRLRTALLLVDVQNTFSGFLYRHLSRLTQVVVTLDTHTAVQIFHPVFWVDEEGEHPSPHTVVSLEDVEAGRWSVNPRVAAAVAPRWWCGRITRCSGESATPSSPWSRRRSSSIRLRGNRRRA